MKFIEADRLKALPPYVFARLDAIKREEMAKGRSLINLSIGDPDLATPDFVIDRFVSAAKDPKNHHYPSYWGLPTFRAAAARFVKRRFSVTMDAETEVCTLIGSKEGVAHFPMAFINPGDRVLVPDIGYPVYQSSTFFAGGSPIYYSLREKNGFLPDLGELENLVARGKPKIFFFNSPNNPTAATASREFLASLVSFCKKHSIIFAHDAAYSELYFDGKTPPSVFEIEGAKDIAIEFHSLSKTFNMTGWRLGFAIGHPDLVAGLAHVKTNIDSGVFNAVQEAGIIALDEGDAWVEKLRGIYQERRDVLYSALQKTPLKCLKPEATFYMWCRLPEGTASEAFVMDLIRRAGVISTPGSGFGTGGEGYVRFTLCNPVPILKKVAEIL